MAKIYQMSLFSWKDIEELGDLERFKLVINTLPDEKLIFQLEKERKNGRDDYPIRPMWNSLLGGILFQHSSIESLRRELQRNAQFREMCGFDPLRGAAAVPNSMNYSRFLAKLIKKQAYIDQMFDDIIEDLREILPDLGKELAFDGKAIQSLAGGPKSEKKNERKKDLRKEQDADWGVKKYKGEDKDGNAWKK